MKKQNKRKICQTREDALYAEVGYHSVVGMAKAPVWVEATNPVADLCTKDKGRALAKVNNH